MKDKIVVSVYAGGLTFQIVAEEFLGGGWRVFINGGLLPNGEDQVEVCSYEAAVAEISEIRAYLLDCED